MSESERLGRELAQQLTNFKAAFHTVTKQELYENIWANKEYLDTTLVSIRRKMVRYFNLKLQEIEENVEQATNKDAFKEQL